MNAAFKMKICAILVLTTSFSAQAQTPVPKGVAFDAIVKAYVARDVKAVQVAYPAFEKAYPGNAYTKFFHAYINDRTGTDIEGALREYSEVIRMAPDLSDPYIYRAMLFSEKGIDDKAIADVTKAIGLEGDQAPADFFSLRGDYYNSTKAYTLALADFKTAIAKAPADASYYRGLMNVAFNAGDPGAADPVFKEAMVGAAKENGAVKFAYGNYLMRLKKMPEADKVFTEVLADKQFRPGGEDLNSAAIAALNVKDMARAIRLCDEAMKLAPTNADIVVNRASIAVQQQAWNDVYKFAEIALAINSNNPLANMLMAVGIKRTGKGDALSAEYEAKAKKLEAEGY